MPGTGLPVVSSRQRVHVRQRERIDSRFSGAHSPLAALVEELERGFMSAAFAARARSCVTRKRPWRRSSRETGTAATSDGWATVELALPSARARGLVGSTHLRRARARRRSAGA
mmetsp:Transcript_10825/g.35567  ORF Transcript_10825/g.35567 Transcript_10825/m.35567 type:complete len:114 (-) Transcript_10825:59-400(-)